MNPIRYVLEKLKNENRKALIAYITSGDPDNSTTVKLAADIALNGADILELGIPYSDPVSEGPVIQRSHARALKEVKDTDTVFETVMQIRKETKIPIVLLTYFNCILQYGISEFFTSCSKSGVNGLIIPDLPHEESGVIKTDSRKNDVYIITLTAPTSLERLDMLLEDPEGYIYCVSSVGVTGMRKEFHDNLENQVAEIKKRTNTPVAVGFGISDASQVKSIKAFADGIIIGSAIVQKIENLTVDNNNTDSISAYIREMRNTLDTP